MVQIHLNQGPVCPADLSEIRFACERAVCGKSDLFPEKSVLAHFQEGRRVRESGAPGFHIWKRSETEEARELAREAQLLLDAVTLKAQKMTPAARKGQYDSIRANQRFEFSLHVSTEATITEIEMLAAKAFGILLKNGQEICKPLARDIATVTKGAMHADHATHAEVTLGFFWGRSEYPRSFGFDGYTGRRGYKDSSSTLVTYAGEPGPLAKVVSDSERLCSYYDRTWCGRGRGRRRQNAFAKLLDRFPTESAQLGDVFSFVRAGSSTPAAIVSTTPGAPRMMIRVNPVNEGWFQHSFNLGVKFGPFADYNFEKLLGSRPKF